MVSREILVSHTFNRMEFGALVLWFAKIQILSKGVSTKDSAPQ